MQAFAFQVFVQINVGYESKKFLIVKAVSCLLEVLLLMSSSSSSSSKDVESSGTLGHLLLQHICISEGCLRTALTSSLDILKSSFFP